MPVLWPVAKDDSGSLVRVEGAARGSSYYCPDCSSPMVARIGEVRAPHFAHKSESICGGEGPRHLMSKRFLSHALSLSGYSAIEEYQHGEFIIDVMARDGDDAFYLEVADSHKCEPEKVSALGDGLIEIDISGWTDEECFLGVRIVSEAVVEITRRKLKAEKGREKDLLSNNTNSPPLFGKYRKSREDGIWEIHGRYRTDLETGLEFKHAITVTKDGKVKWVALGEYLGMDKWGSHRWESVDRGKVIGRMKE